MSSASGGFVLQWGAREQPRMKTSQLRATVVGATGLVGHHLVQRLFEDPRFDRVTVLTRRATGLSHPKLQEHLIDFDAPESYSALVAGDVLFSALGTTMKKAGTAQAQYKVDHTYQLDVATAGRRNGVGTYVLVSSLSASPDSRFFYMRMKGELERDVLRLGFARTRILRPGALDGERQEFRLTEKLGLVVLRAVSKLPFARPLQPIHADAVAASAIGSVFDGAEAIRKLELRPSAAAG